MSRTREENAADLAHEENVAAQTYMSHMDLIFGALEVGIEGAGENNNGELVSMMGPLAEEMRSGTRRTAVINIDGVDYNVIVERV